MSADQLRSDRIPAHVAIIMDGNGRWAQARGLERNEGHRAGIEAVRAVIRGANDLGIRYLTLYAFSSENWGRPQDEVRELMQLLDRYLVEELDEVMEKGIRIRAIGRLDRLPPETRKQVENATRKTAGNDAMDLVFALSYGGRAEIVQAARRIARDAAAGELDPHAIDEKLFASYLYEPEVPDPDLLIRTGAESRVSNFLLWQIAYTEIYTTERMWPDFREEHLIEAVRNYQARERRFGKTSAQVSGQLGSQLGSPGPSGSEEPA